MLFPVFWILDTDQQAATRRRTAHAERGERERPGVSLSKLSLSLSLSRLCVCVCCVCAVCVLCVWAVWGVGVRGVWGAVMSLTPTPLLCRDTHPIPHTIALPASLQCNAKFRGNSYVLRILLSTVQTKGYPGYAM